ncbi:DEAD/DEAH box helicase family protein, partial [Legionella maceachernii]
NPFDALTDFNAALALQPNDVFALARRGEVYRQSNQFDNALTDLNAALALQPNDVFALARRGAVYRQMGDLDNALVDLNKAFDNSPQDGFILHQRSLVYWQQNKNDAALNDLDAWESQSEEHVAEFVQVAEIAEEETSSEPTPKESLVSKDFSSNPIRIEASDEQVLPETSGLSLTPTPMETDNLAFGSINTEEQAGSSTGSQNSGEETSRTTKEFKKPWQKNALFSAKYSAKYERLPPAPIRLFHTHRNNYSQVFDFKTLESCELSENTMGARRLISLSIGQSTFRLSTMKREHPASDETVTFIFAGRKENAMLPHPAALGDKQRLLLVVSAGEYKSFSNLNYTDAVEFLIIDSLESSTHGSYQIEDIQARRLAAFILSFHWQLKHCVYLDDNLELIQSTPNYPALSTWAEITDVLKADRDKEKAVLCGMQTFSYKPHYYVEPDYCYKLFNLDFQQLTQLLHLETADDVFILGYPAKYSGYCMQDFYFQMIIDFALYAANSKQETGHLMKKLVYLPPMESISLKRMKQNQNAAKAYTRGLIEDILTITTDEFVPQGIREEYVQLMKESLMHLHNEIKRSFNLMSKKRRELVTRDFRSIVQANNQIAPSESFNNLEPELLEKNAKKPKKSAKPIPINDNFLRTNWVGCQISALAPAEVVDTYLQEKPVSDSLYPHQLAAIKMISRCNQSHGVLKMATGSGKTRVQIVFANFLIKRNPNAVIHIVVPTVQLVNQFYQEFVQTLDTLEESGAIKKENIVPVHSKENGVAAGLITLNTIFRSEASVYIFCEASYSKMLATAEKNLANHRAPLLIMLDEFHLYKHKARILMDSGVSTLGFSATPGPDIVPLYEFNRADSRAALRTAPLIIDRLSYSLNLEKNEKKHNKIAVLIRHHRHPMGKPLACYKGIIYTSSIEEANDLTSAINEEAGEQLAQAIHSQVKDYKKWIELFRKKSLETPAILVVVDMLGTGYDDKDVVWGLFAKNNGVGVENHSQMAGRGLRLNSDYPEKIAYMLTDDDLLFDIQEIYKDEDALIMAHPDYYTYNREVIYLELLNAVEKQRPFKHYSAMFRHNKLNYSLSKHLILLMKALDSNEQEWVQGLLSENRVLKKNWKDQRGKVFNLIGTFLNEVIGLQEGHQDPLKARLFTVDAFQNVLNAVHSHSSALLKQLLTDASVQRTLTEQFKKVSGEYFTIFQQYRSLVNSPNTLPNRYGFLQRLDRPRGSNFYLQEPMVSNTYSSQSSL